MLSASRSSFKLSIIAAAFVMLAAYGKPAQAQDSVTINSNYVRITGLPDDWSHHHLVFSNPGTEQDAIRNGRDEQWHRIVNDPRYVIHQLKRGLPAQGPSGQDAAYWKALVALDAKDRKEHEWDGHDRKRRDKHGNPAPGATEIKGDWGMSMGPLAKAGANQFPAKFSFLTTSAYCASDTTPDFVAYNTGLAGSGGATGSAGAAGQASIIAFDNIYTGCSGSAHPEVYWAYNTGGTVSTSPVISEDGSQLAFVHSAAGGASLVVLKWKAGEGSSAGNPSAASVPSIPASQYTSLQGSNYATCRTGSTSCQITIGFSGTHNDTNSSPFYDYTNDVLYVGDNSGVLHKFSGIFTGSPAEITTSPWPETMSNGNILSSPVLDPASGNVFVGSSAGTLIYVPSAGGTIVTSGALINGGTGVVDAPMLDSTAGRAYVFVGNDHNNTHCNGGNPCFAGVYQFITSPSFAATTTGVEETLGGSNSTSSNIYDGTFDNIYFTSTSPASPAGNLYVCGLSSGGATPTLYQIPISGTGSTTIGTPVTGPAIETPPGNCSPVTEFDNSPTDYIFLSATGTNKTTTPISCPTGTGCLMSFDVTSASGFGTSKATLKTALEASGTSGIVIDNSVSSPTGTSQVYFTPLANQSCGGNGTTGAGTGGCAIQASQSGLQ